MKRQRKTVQALKRAALATLGAVPVVARLALVAGALGLIGYGMEGIRPRLGYLAVGVLLWWELRTAGRRPAGGSE